MNGCNKVQSKVCTKCSVERSVSEYSPDKRAKDGLNTECKPCKNARQRIYRAKNLKARREANKKWRAGATAHLKAYQKTYHAENRDARNKARRNYQKNNKGKVAANNAKRRAAKMNRTVGWADLEAIKAIYKQASQLTVETGIQHHVDHIIPMQGQLVSGLHVETNLQILTASENCAKGNSYEVFCVL